MLVTLGLILLPEVVNAPELAPLIALGLLVEGDRVPETVTREPEGLAVTVAL